MINQADKLHTFRKCAQLFPMLISYFSATYIAALVIDGVTASKPVSYLIVSALIVCGINLAVRVTYDVINRKANFHNFGYDLNMGKLLSGKIMNMDYSKIEDVKTQNDYRKAANQMENGSTGLPAIEWGVYSSLNGLLTAAIGISLTAPTIIREPLVKEGFIGFVQSAWGLLAVALVVAAVAVVQSVFVIPRTMKMFDENLNSDEMMSAYRVRDFFRNYSVFNYRTGKDIRIYGQQELILDKYNSSIKNMYDMRTKCWKNALLTNGIMELLNIVSKISMYGFAVIRAASGMMTPGEVVAFVVYFMRIQAGVVTFSSQLSYLFNLPKYCKRIFDFLDIPDEKYKGTIPTEKRDDNEYEFEFKNVWFKYPNTEQYILKNVNLKWRIGEKMALVGKNGSGKSTLVKLLCRLYDPTEGEITLNGIDIRKYNYGEYMALFSMVFQDSKLLSFSMGENIAASLNYDREYAEDCVKRAGLSELLQKMPEGIETCLYKDFDEKGVEISGGEAQKLCLARAVYKGAPFIILDEPTAALDPISEHDIYTHFNSIVGTRTAIYISHRLSSCRFCDDITVLDNGSVAEKGSHSELLEKHGKYFEMWQAQAEYYKDTAGALFK